MKKHFASEILETGIQKFLEAQNTDFLIKMIKIADFKPISTDSQKELVSQLISLIQLLGAETFLSRFEVPLLKSLMRDMKLECDTTSKVAIVEAITQHKDAKSTAPLKPKGIVFSKVKPDIEAGVTYQDLFQHYFVDELSDYCRDNDLKISGNKPDLIKRIIASFEEDKENQSKSKSKGKKIEASKSKKTVEESKSKKETTKEKEKEVESEEEKEIEKVEESKSKKVEESKSKKTVEESKSKKTVEESKSKKEKENTKEKEKEKRKYERERERKYERERKRKRKESRIG